MRRPSIGPESTQPEYRRLPENSWRAEASPRRFGRNLPLNVFLEGANLLLIGAWKASHGPLDHIKVALRSGSHLFEIFKHHGSNGFERVFVGCHVTLPASYAIYLQVSGSEQQFA
jgi:hypothetical protein